MSESVFESNFVFATCRPGAESAVKEEYARDARGFRFAYSRPGFLTFKSIAAPLSLDSPAPASYFARARGLVVDKATGENSRSLAKAVWDNLLMRHVVESHSVFALYVWPRIVHSTIAGPSDAKATEFSGQARADLVETAPPELSSRVLIDSKIPSPRGRLVIDVVVVEPTEWWVGMHRATSWVGRWPGGVITTEVPDSTISKAYEKMAEAIAWSRLPIQNGDVCVELGCAPGGAAEALLDRDLRVIGVDPAEVDPKLLERPNFTHVRKRAAEVRKRDLRDAVWLAADMNVAPQYTLDAVESIVTHDAVRVRGMLLTLKLFDWRMASQLPEFIARVRGWGYKDVRARQLVSGGQEICVVALKSRSARRRSPNRRRSGQNARNAAG